ncbi:MAG TPA: tetratricopeptide repeat protein [Phycisphaerales bacterium]|nr:tetratricopeptide repeat protein [Phycisphaerales bacterium]
MADAASDKSAGAKASWKDAWQGPALVVGAAALVGAAGYAFVTRPKHDVTVDFRAAETLMDEKEYAKALETLGQRVLPVLNKGGLSKEQEQGFYLMRARALYLGQREAGVDRKENHENIVTEYARAEKAGAELTWQDSVYLLRTHVALKDLDKAAGMLAKIPEEQREERIARTKDLIELSLANKEGYPRALELLTQLSADTALGNEDRLWALSRQAKLQVAQGYYEDAATRILRTLPRVMADASPDLKGDVLLTLARAYVGQKDFAGATAQLERAIEAMGPNAEQLPEALVLAGQVAQQTDDLETARQKYGSVLDGFERSVQRPAAMLGLAETEAEMLLKEGAGEVPERSLERYQTLVDGFADPEYRATFTKETLAESMLDRASEQAELGAHRTSLRFSALARSLYERGKVPADVLLMMAESRRALAEELLRPESGAAGELLSLDEVDPTTQREARELLLAAAEDYREYGNLVVKDDAEAYAESLWNAGDSYDRAGATDEAIDAFRQFAGDFSSDNRQPEAKFRLGQAYRARGDAKLAEQVFRDLIVDSDGSGRAGPYSDAAYVPLAQTLLSDGDEANDEEASGLLETVLSGRLGGTSTQRYRDALREMGDMHYAKQQHEQAAEKFEEYVQRVEKAIEQETPGIDADALLLPTARYRLADSLRLSTRAIDKQLTTAMPDEDARKLRQLREARLSRASELYETVCQEFAAMGGLTSLEELMMRNAFFYRGDCAFDLGDFDAAIRHYDAARERYPKDPAALVAMTQVVSAYLARGEIEKASVANLRAKQFYESLPETAWSDVNLPMGKRDWERWLAAQQKLTAQLATENER